MRRYNTLGKWMLPRAFLKASLQIPHVFFLFEVFFRAQLNKQTIPITSKLFHSIQIIHPCFHFSTCQNWFHFHVSICLPNKAETVRGHSAIVSFLTYLQRKDYWVHYLLALYKALLWSQSFYKRALSLWFGSDRYPRITLSIPSVIMVCIKTCKARIKYATC